MSKKRYPPRKPNLAAGLRLQAGRSRPREWWSQRLLQEVERMNLGTRVARGRNYAQSGQVLELKLDGGRITATVMGARTTPYKVAVDFSRLEAEAHRAVVEQLRAWPIWIARILAGDLPTEIEGVFKAVGGELFPGGKRAEGGYDVTFTCSCPDYANPCKHSAAVMHLLAELLAAEPARLLSLRGIELSELTR